MSTTQVSICAHYHPNVTSWPDNENVFIRMSKHEICAELLPCAQLVMGNLGTLSGFFFLEFSDMFYKIESLKIWQ